MQYQKDHSGLILAVTLLALIVMLTSLAAVFFAGCATTWHQHEVVDTETRLLQSAEKWRGQNINDFADKTTTLLQKSTTKSGVAVYTYSIKEVGNTVDVDGIRFTQWYDVKMLTMPNGTIVDVDVEKRLAVSR